MEADSVGGGATRRLSRRGFIGLAAGGAGLVLRCGGASGPPAKPAAAPTASGAPAGAALGGPAAAEVATARPLERVRFVYVAQSAIFGPAWVAQEEGYYAKYGLDAELSNIPGATRLQQAVLAGEVDYQLVAGPTSIGATVAGAPTPIVANLIELPVWQLIVRPEITRIEDLRGKRIAISQIGSATDYVLRKVLRRWGMEPDRDVTLLQMGGTQEIFAGLAGGAVDAGPMAAPLHLRAQREGYRPLLDLADAGIVYPQMVLSATRAYLDAHPEPTLNLLRALAEGTRRYKTDRALALDVLARYTGDTEPEMLEAAWVSAVKLLKDVPTISEEAVRGVLEDLAAERPEARTIAMDAVVDHRYVRQLEAEGFFTRLAEGQA
jgi:ABC-type nitrate/sulfonate/bicarbonate transport system substrate-binding protein